MELGTYMFLRSVEISQDGKWMIAGSGYSKKDRSQIHIWNLKSKKLHYSLENFKPDQSINVDVTKVFIAEDSKHLVVYDTYSIKLWDLETKDLLKTIPLPDRHMENPAICQTRNGDIKVLLHDYTHKTDTVIYTSRFPISALEKDSLNKFSGEELGL